MATGRTTSKWLRVFVGGYDMSGYVRKVGSLDTVFDENDLTTLSDPIRGYLPGQASVKCGNLSAMLDGDAAGMFALKSAGAGSKQIVTACLGIRAIPAQGDPCFTAQMQMLGFGAEDDGGAATVTIPFSEWASDGSSLLYPRGWGWILNANVARTGVNASAGIDDNGAATSRGGYLVYHVTASSNPAHTATLKVQDAAVNADGSFADLAGATTGVITVTAGVSGIVAISPTATVRQYLRWQIVLGTATSVTFLLAFVRGF